MFCACLVRRTDPESEEIYQLETMLSATLSCDHRVGSRVQRTDGLLCFVH